MATGGHSSPQSGDSSTLGVNCRHRRPDSELLVSEVKSSLVTSVIRVESASGKPTPKSRIPAKPGIFQARRSVFDLKGIQTGGRGQDQTGSQTDDLSPGSSVAEPSTSSYHQRYKVVKKTSQVDDTVSVTTASGKLTKNQRAKFRRFVRRENKKNINQDVEVAKQFNFNKLVKASLKLQRRARFNFNRSKNISKLLPRAYTEDERNVLRNQLLKAQEESKKLLREAESRLEAAYQFIDKDYKRESWPTVYYEVVVQQKRHLRVVI